MLSTLIIVLLLLWLLGVGTSYTLGLLLRVIQGRNPLRG
jgi:hypothetical protein